MYKNQLQELAQRSCFNLPSYTCIREGPDHAPRFKAIVNFNGESFESPQYCSTLRQAEHAAAEVALNSLSSRGPSHSLAARILDETGVYKNLLQEISQRVGAPLPHYTTYRSGLGHQPVFTGKVELAGIIFTGEPAKNKKQAEKNAALASWQSLKQLAHQSGSSSSEQENTDELEQVTIARALLRYRLRERMTTASSKPLPFPQTFPIQNPRPSSPQRRPVTASKILPLICPKKTLPRVRPLSYVGSDNSVSSSHSQIPESRGSQSQRFPGLGAPPYIPMRHVRAPCHGIAPPVTIRNAIPCYSAPPVPRSSAPAPPVMRTAPPVRIAPPVCIRQSVPVFSAPPPLPKEDLSTVKHLESNKASDEVEAVEFSTGKESQESKKTEPVVKPLPLANMGPSVTRAFPTRTAPSVCIRQAIPVFAAPPVKKVESSSPMEPRDSGTKMASVEETQDSEAVEKLELLKL
ncbi:double-stranded RNA-binding protein 2 [Beta vulgaris subsp. vulgaris]|uniref:double-stranded RNA-binding protein 2 n=1 Tax=Beta vulgaris subsp. vulgaris TaxID=3555 RepID=UPI00203725C2|nr:double-stranded RNA-binding protein 2 [Beta vulgaris subsp. vulgaris]